MLSPEVLAPHPSSIPSPGGALRAWLGGPPQLNPTPSVGSEVRGEPRQCVGNVLCRVLCRARQGREEGVQAAPFPPYTLLQLVNGAPEVSGTEKRRRNAGVGYSFDSLGQFLLQTWACLGWEGGRADWLRLRGSRATPYRMMGEECVCTCLCSCAYVYTCVWCLYMCVAT